MQAGSLSLLQALSDPVLVTDDEGIIVYANEAAQALCGNTTDRLVGSPIWSVVDHWTLLWGEGEHSGSAEGTMFRHDNLPVPVEMSFAVWDQDGRRTIGAVIRSIAARKAAEAMQAEAQRAAKQAEREARAANKRLREAMEVLPEAIVMLDKQDRFVLWNGKYETLFPEIVHLLEPGAYYPDVLRASLESGEHPEVVDDRETWLERRMRDHALPVAPTETRLRDGRWLRYDERRTSDGGSIGVRIDITQLKQRETGFRLLFEDNPVPMMIVDAETSRFMAANDAALEHYGFTRDEFLAITAPDLHVAEEQETVRHILRTKGATNNTLVNWRHRTARGEIKVMIYARELTYDDRSLILAAIVDVTERAKIVERIEHLANHDALTGLCNRACFRTALDKALAVRRREEDRVALVYLDLDGFKPVNDTYGHLVGDEVLTMVGARIKGAVRETDLAARLGGDEFAILLTKATMDPEGIAARILDALREPYTVGDRTIRMAASVGIASAPRDGLAADRLMAHADKALYEAKRAGRNTVKIYRPDFGHDVRKSA